jgi:hypothetical protein
LIVAAVLLLTVAAAISGFTSTRASGGLVETRRTVEETETPAGATKTVTAKSAGKEAIPPETTQSTTETIPGKTIKTTTESSQPVVQNTPQALATAGLILLLVGVPLCAPQVLHDSAKELSAMRVVFYGIAGVFGILAIRAGWDAKSLGDVKIDSGWAGLLSAAFAAKAAQSFSENRG